MNSDRSGLESEVTIGIVAFMAVELAETHADYSELQDHSNLLGLKVRPGYGDHLVYFDADSTFDRVVEVLWNFAVIQPLESSVELKADFPCLPKYSMSPPSEFHFLVARDQIREQVLKLYDGSEKFDYVLANFVGWLWEHYDVPVHDWADISGIANVLNLLDRLGYIAQVDGRFDKTAALEPLLARGLAKEREVKRVYQLRERISKLPMGPHFLVSLYAILRQPEKAIAVLHRRSNWNVDDARDAIKISYPSLRVK